MSTSSLGLYMKVAIDQPYRREDRHHVLVCLSELRPFFSTPTWQADEEKIQSPPSITLPLSLSLSHSLLHLSHRHHFPTVSSSPCFQSPSKTPAQHMERQRLSDSLRLGEKEQDGEHIAWSVRSYKGLSAERWLLLRTEKYMTDFLINCSKRESTKCCLSLCHADKHISHCHTHTHIRCFSPFRSLSPTHTHTLTHKNFQSHTFQAPTPGEWM